MNTRKRTRGKPRMVRLDAGTVVAVDEMLQFIESASGGGFAGSPRRKGHILNVLIRSMCEAVVGFAPSEAQPNPKGVTFVDRLTGRPLLHWPLVFDARAETEEEMEMRVMLQTMSEGES